MLMDEQRIRQVIRQEIQSANNNNRFALQSIPKHTHNGVDSVSIYSPTITYTGLVPADGDVFNAAYSIIFPSGWGLEKLAGPLYRVAHNLGTNLYTVTACLTGESGPTAIPIIIAGDVTFDIFWYDVQADALVEANFVFQMVQVNNKRNALPTYTLNDPL